MTPADWAALAPGAVALVLHWPALARSRRHARQLAALDRGGPRWYTPAPGPMARRAPPGPDASSPARYGFQNDSTGHRWWTSDERTARDLMADPEWRLLDPDPGRRGD